MVSFKRTWKHKSLFFWTNELFWKTIVFYKKDDFWNEFKNYCFYLKNDFTERLYSEKTNELNEKYTLVLRTKEISFFERLWKTNEMCRPWMNETRTSLNLADMAVRCEMLEEYVKWIDKSTLWPYNWVLKEIYIFLFLS